MGCICFENKEMDLYFIEDPTDIGSRFWIAERGFPSAAGLFPAFISALYT